MTLSNETQNILREQYATLPKDVQGAILSATLRDMLNTLQTKYTLNTEQAGAIENETLFIMLGLEHPRDYLKNLSQGTNLPPEKVREIATEVNEKVFKPIRESLKKIHGIGDEKKDVNVPKAPQTPETPQLTRQASLQKELPTLQATSYPDFPVKENRGSSILINQNRDKLQTTGSGFYPRAQVKKEGIVPTATVPTQTPQPTQPSQQVTPRKESSTLQPRENLPNDVTTAIASVQVTEQIQSIGTKYGLHIDTLGTLLDETHNVMQGKTHPKDYIRNIQSRLQINSEKARQVATDVNEWIFKPIRESLKKIHGIGEEEREPAPSNSKLQGPRSDLQTPAPKTSASHETREGLGTKNGWQEPKAAVDEKKESETQLKEYFDRDTVLKKIEEPPRAVSNIKTPEAETRVAPPRKSSPEEKSEPLETKRELDKPKDLVRKKLESSFSIPSQEKSYTKAPTEPAKSAEQRQNKYESDPYREAAK